MKYPNWIHAWDTETINIDAKEESPVGKGEIVCASCFIGPDVNFGNGPRLFIDNYGEAKDTILTFKDYLENDKYWKVFHNWGYDRHIFYNHGINVKGFGGDTLHMAWLLDSSGLSYSLSNLTEQYEKDILSTKEKLIEFYEKQGPNETLQFYKENFFKIKKRNLMESFGFYKTLRNNGIGKVMLFPEIEE